MRVGEFHHRWWWLSSAAKCFVQIAMSQRTSWASLVTSSLSVCCESDSWVLGWAHGAWAVPPALFQHPLCGGLSDPVFWQATQPILKPTFFFFYVLVSQFFGRKLLGSNDIPISLQLPKWYYGLLKSTSLGCLLSSFIHLTHSWPILSILPTTCTLSLSSSSLHQPGYSNHLYLSGYCSDLLNCQLPRAGFLFVLRLSSNVWQTS
jgi:hypothetical protein